MKRQNTPAKTGITPRESQFRNWFGSVFGKKTNSSGSSYSELELRLVSTNNSAWDVLKFANLSESRWTVTRHPSRESSQLRFSSFVERIRGSRLSPPSQTRTTDISDMYIKRQTGSTPGEPIAKWNISMQTNGIMRLGPPEIFRSKCTRHFRREGDAPNFDTCTCSPRNLDSESKR